MAVRRHVLTERLTRRRCGTHSRMPYWSHKQPVLVNSTAIEVPARPRPRAATGARPGGSTSGERPHCVTARAAGARRTARLPSPAVLGRGGRETTMRLSYWTRRVAYVLSLGTVTSVAALASYSHQVDVALLAHQASLLAHTLPL